MSIIEDKGLDSTIAYGLYGCKEDNEKIFINCVSFDFLTTISTGVFAEKENKHHSFEIG